MVQTSEESLYAISVVSYVVPLLTICYRCAVNKNDLTEECQAVFQKDYSTFHHNYVYIDGNVPETVCLE